MNKDYTPSKANQEKVRVTKEQVKRNKMKKQQNHKERKKTERKENYEQIKNESKIHKKNEFNHYQFLEITSERNKIVEKYKLIDAHYQVFHKVFLHD